MDGSSSKTIVMYCNYAGFFPASWFYASAINRRYFFRSYTSVCPSVNTYFAWRAISLCGERISMKLIPQIFIIRVRFAEKVCSNKVRHQRSRSTSAGVCYNGGNISLHFDGVDIWRRGVNVHLFSGLGSKLQFESLSTLSIITVIEPIIIWRNLAFPVKVFLRHQCTAALSRRP